MKRATIRDLRTQFPKVRWTLEQEGQMVVTDRGRPIILLFPYREPIEARNRGLDYYARLRL